MCFNGIMLQLTPFPKAFVRVVRRRWRQGPRRPSWSLPLEVMLDVLKERMMTAPGMPPAQFRQEQDAFAASVPSMALGDVGRRRERIGGVDGEWLVPWGARDSSVLLYFHGGGYVMGSIHTHGDLMAMLAMHSGIRVFAPSYRLAPEHPYPAAVDDAVAVFEGLLASGFAPDRIVVGGDSAGGGLSLAMMLRRRDAGRPLPGGALLISPWVDLTVGMPSVEENGRYDFGDRTLLSFWAGLYCGGAAATDPLISPLLAELRGLPPLAVFAGECELLIDEIRALVDRARAASVDVDFVCAPDLTHNYLMLYLLSRPAALAIGQAAAFVRSVISRQPNPR
jgi:monoterpene epsilon-lactone hydrolase